MTEQVPTELLPTEVWKRIFETLPAEESLSTVQACSFFHDLIASENKVRLLCDQLGDYNDTPKDRALIKALHDFYLPTPTLKQLQLYVQLRSPIWEKLQQEGHPKPWISLPTRIALLLKRNELYRVPLDKYLRAIYLYGEDADLDQYLKSDTMVSLKGLAYLIAAAKPQHYQWVLDQIDATGCEFAIELFTDLQRLRDWLAFVHQSGRHNICHKGITIQITLVDKQQWIPGIQNDGLYGPTGNVGSQGYIRPPSMLTVTYLVGNRRSDFVQQPWSKLRGLFASATLPSMTSGLCTRVDTQFLSALLTISYQTPFEQWIDRNGIQQRLYQKRGTRVRVSGNIGLIAVLDTIRSDTDKVNLSVSQFQLERLYHARQYEVIRRIWFPEHTDYHQHSDPSGRLLVGHEEILALTKNMDPRNLVHYESILDQYPSYFLTESFGQQLLDRGPYLNEIVSPKIRWFLGCIAGFMNQLDILQELITYTDLTKPQLDQLLQSAKAGCAMTCYHWLQGFVLKQFLIPVDPSPK